jgi:hypothetical protein
MNTWSSAADPGLEAAALFTSGLFAEPGVGSEAFRRSLELLAPADPRFDRRMLPVLEIHDVGEDKCMDMDRRGRLVGVSSVTPAELAELFFGSGDLGLSLLVDWL